MELFKTSSKFSKKQIILLSIPVFFSNMAIPLVGMIDTGLMGNLSETKYLAATSIATSVMTMIVWSFGFLRMGTVGLVAQAYGRSDYREIVKTILNKNAAATPHAIIFLLFSVANPAAIKPIMIALSAAITISMRIICTEIITCSNIRESMYIRLFRYIKE